MTETKHKAVVATIAAFADRFAVTFVILETRRRPLKIGIAQDIHAAAPAIDNRHFGFPDGHPFRHIRAMPADVALPPIHLLGSSGYSAELAAVIGAGFAFGDATERAYQRFDLPKKRRALAEAWAAFCLSPPAVETGTVLPMQLAR